MYTYLFSNLFGHQFLEPVEDSNKNSSLFKEVGVSISNTRPFMFHTPVVHIPFFTLIEFVAYLGWIKVAETLLNPWGDDDEDFQINYLIDRNFQVICWNRLLKIIDRQVGGKYFNTQGALLTRG